MTDDLARDAQVPHKRVPPVADTCDRWCAPDPVYEPSEPTRRGVRYRHARCVFPGCRAPATGCDLDHTVPWPAGSTCVHNLAPMCRCHHELKTMRIWTCAGGTSTG